ncbi:MAG: Stf0 family sulfotransferase [Arenibacterium sp.]
MKQFDAYVICTSPRSGSTLLCKLLQEAGNAGLPESYFHEPSLEKWLDAYGLQKNDFNNDQDALHAVFDAVRERGTGKSDIFGLRLQRHSFAFFAEQLAVLFPSRGNDKSRFEAAFGKTLFVHLTRENKLDQAISYVRARQTGLWHIAPDGTELERLGPPRAPQYDGAAISAKRQEFVRMDADWTAWFEKQHITPLRIPYDTLSSAPYTTCARLLRALGREAEPVNERTPPVAKLADHINQDWADRFRKPGKTTL